ncbi:MAG: exodeoxyribonuclease VII large subunit [Syntrophales bacterium]|nr:exodeoxyribonuclease VII large subunit [Syntrophales bacterium]MDD5533360.1 exodeoxyribonuclease VII large subunit [Syntrophales bacterium]
MKKVLTVTELTRNIQFLLESSFDLVWVEGEISNLRRPNSGHVYFTLKDDKSQVRAVIFRQALRGILFELEDGTHILCRAGLTVYSPRGEYQLIIDMIEPKGLGALQLAFEQLKARLEREGLFDPSWKKPIPFIPERIGVVTSPSGAVIRDILHITGRRFPSVDILLAPVRVQGPEAPLEIVQAIEILNAVEGVDVIIVARGGGSLEDLMAFNDERVARAIFQSRLPVISAVGHETDFTISDFVSDLRAPTPSAAAEMAVPVRKELLRSTVEMAGRIGNRHRRLVENKAEGLERLRERLHDPSRGIADRRIHFDAAAGRLVNALRTGIERGERNSGILRERLHASSPVRGIRDRRILVDALGRDLKSHLFRRTERIRDRLAGLVSVLDSLSPLAVLKRGYGLVRTVPEGTIVRSSASVDAGREVDVKVAEGSFTASVTKTRPE